MFPLFYQTYSLKYHIFHNNAVIFHSFLCVAFLSGKSRALYEQMFVIIEGMFYSVYPDDIFDVEGFFL